MRVLTIDVPHLGTGPTSCTTGASGSSSIRRATPNPSRRPRRRPGSTSSPSRRPTSTTTTSRAGLPLPAPRRGVPRWPPTRTWIRPLGVHDNETLAFGDIDLRVIATPGHTPLHLSTWPPTRRPGATRRGPSSAAAACCTGPSGALTSIDPSLTTALTRAQWLTARRLGALPADDDPAPDPRLRQLLRQHPAAPPRRRPSGPSAPTTPALTTARDTFVEQLLEGSARCPATTHTWPAATVAAPGHHDPAPARRRPVGAASRAASRRRPPQQRGLRGRTPARLAGGPGRNQCAVYVGWITPGEASSSSSRTPRGAGGHWNASSAGSASRPSGRPCSTPTSSGGRGWTGLRRTDWAGFGRAPRSRHRRDRRTTPRRVARGTPRRAPSTSPSTTCPTGSTRSRRARSGCTAPPATARPSQPACSTAPVATSCWSTTTSRGSPTSESPCCVGDPPPQPWIARWPPDM